MDGRTSRGGKVRQRSDKVLVGGQTIALSPILARAVGLEEALVLQQLFFRMRCANSDPQRRWICVAHQGRTYVGWNDIGRQEDLLLSKYPYRRVFNNLRKLGVVHDAQHLEQPFDQRIFLSINFVRLRTICPECAISMGEKNDMEVRTTDLSKQHDHSLSLGNRDREQERELRVSPSLDKLISEVAALAGTGPRDNGLRDKKCVERIRQMIESGIVGAEDLETIVRSPHTKFPSEVEEALLRRVKAVNECLQAVARAELSATEQLDKQRAAELEKKQSDQAKQFLAFCPDHTLQLIVDEIRQLNVAPALVSRAIAAVTARGVGHVPASTLVMRVLTSRLTDHTHSPLQQ